MSIIIRGAELSDGKYKLVTNGGESSIYRYDDHNFMKIFKPNVVLDLKEKKVSAWIRAKNIPFVISPIDDIRIGDQFVGFLLKEIEGADNIGNLAKKKNIRLNRFTNKDILEILIDYSKKLEYIHKERKIVGDINDTNVLIKGKNIYFIDSDSYGIEDLPADAYSETYTDPNAYKYTGNKLRRIELNQKTDMFAFAIFGFKLLTRMHPFNGKYEKDIDMNTMTRIKNRISVLGNHNIGIPPMIDSWKWMSPKLLDSFLKIFEQGERKYITSELEELFYNMKFCDKDGIYYYNKYAECPLCNEKAKVNIMPSINVVKTTGGIGIKVIFTSKDVNYFFGFDKYLSYNLNFVHLLSKNTWNASSSYRVEFSQNGEYVFEIYDSKILVYNAKTKKFIFTINKSYKSSVSIYGEYIYYIDDTLRFCRTRIVNSLNLCENLLKVYVNTLFEVCDNDYLIIFFYDKKMLINSKKYNVFLNYDDKIYEYAIKFDSISKNWLFIYETNSGNHRTIVISSNGKIIFDSTIYKYQTMSLSNICFANNTIFYPSFGKIVGINFNKNRVKNFVCRVVNEESALSYRNGGFDIITDNTIYRFGV